MRKEIRASEARLEMQRRRTLTARQLTAELAQSYGNEFNDTKTYMPRIESAWQRFSDE